MMGSYLYAYVERRPSQGEGGRRKQNGDRNCERIMMLRKWGERVRERDKMREIT